MLDNTLIKEIESLKLPQSKNYYTAFFKLLLLRRTSEFLLIALLQYVGLMLSNAEQLHMPIWPASGVALGLLFLRGNRILPGLFVGSFIAYLQSHYPLSLNLAFSSLLCFQAYLIRTLCLKWIGPIIPFKRLDHIILFFFMTLICSTLIMGGYYWLFIQHYQLSFNLIALLQITLGNFCGILFFAPICFLWDNIIPTGKKFNIPYLKFLLIFSPPCLSIILLFAMPTYVGFALVLLTTLPFSYLALRSYQQIGLQMMLVVLSIFIISFIPPSFFYPEKLTWLMLLQAKCVVEWAMLTNMKRHE